MSISSGRSKDEDFLLDERVDRVPIANKGCGGDEQRATCFDAKTSEDGPRMTFELMTKKKLDASVKRQCHARGVSLINYFDRAKTTR